MRYRNSWQIQQAVFHALLIRELKTRFGGYRLGFFWAIIEPVSHILVLTILFSLIRDRIGFFGVPFPLFFATGVLSFFVFQKIVITSISSISANMGLFVYRQVKPFDAIVVRAVLELIVILIAMILLVWFGMWFFELDCLPNDPISVILVISLLFMIASGIGFFVSVIGAKNPEASQLISIMMRPMYFISGIFFPLQAMPEKFHIYLLWNPILHAVEQFRAAWFIDYPADGTSLKFLFMCALPIFLLGLSYYRNNRTRVLMS